MREELEFCAMLSLEALLSELLFKIELEFGKSETKLSGNIPKPNTAKLLGQVKGFPHSPCGRCVFPFSGCVFAVYWRGLTVSEKDKAQRDASRRRGRGSMSRVAGGFIKTFVGGNERV